MQQNGFFLVSAPGGFCFISEMQAKFIFYLLNQRHFHVVLSKALENEWRRKVMLLGVEINLFDLKRATALLRLGCQDPTAQFREGQAAAIRFVTEGKGRLLVVQKTGWGKSFVYFIATKLLREAGMGPALLISPLLALMRNQVAAARRMGLRAATINSSNCDEWPEIIRALQNDEIDILLISPERLANAKFQNEILVRVMHRISLLIVDEAHCISDWGHDFRPHYRRLSRIIRALPPGLRLLATTATANQRVISDLQTVLGPNLKILRGDLNRPSLTLQTICLPSQAERMAWLAEKLPEINGSGIIYTLTVRDAYRVADWLKQQGMKVEAYTGRSGGQREVLEQALLDNRLKALVATTALGMGFDKPDLAFVIHYQSPGSVISYYQQVGRAGRAIDKAYGILLSGEEETQIVDYFIERAFPTPQQVEKVLDALEDAPDGLTISQLLGCVNLSKQRIQQTLDLLSLEAPAPVVKEGYKWHRTHANLSNTFWKRVERLTRLRRQEQQEMQQYVALPFGKHMHFLIKALDGDPDSVEPSRLPPLSATVSPEMVKKAVDFLRRTSIPIEPRKQWPINGMPLSGVKGRIPASLQALPGKALCVWGDAGWGEMVRQGKYHDNRFADELVDACVRLIKDWQPVPAPQWVTCIPSRRHPQLVPDFAQRLAQALGLPFRQVLAKTRNTPEQKSMANSVQQAWNVDGSFTVKERPLPGPVLLVDDMVDSRWTFTVAAWLLRKHGSGMVLPLALAHAGGI